MIASVTVWENGMVLVFDEEGQQMPEYQGNENDVMERILKDKPNYVKIEHRSWPRSGR